ncbi:MAG: hypothetical protein CMH54_04130 [Myxococcales bacterium]|nr:hypothetical protein [Myxococcales bacterium]|tara:strand:- start:206 stop:625 length:420 start_codon:yes stop_codon:yes gene_type:complete
MALLDTETRICVLQVLTERYREYEPDLEYTLVEHELSDGVELRCTAALPDRSQVIDLDVRVLTEDHKNQKPVDRLHLCIDVLGFLLDQYFIEDPGVLPPLDWQELDYAGARTYICGRERNEQLEQMADHLLDPPDEPSN